MGTLLEQEAHKRLIPSGDGEGRGALCIRYLGRYEKVSKRGNYATKTPGGDSPHSVGPVVSFTLQQDRRNPPATCGGRSRRGKQREGLRSERRLRRQDCGGKEGPLEISRKEMEVYREAAVAFGGGMGCPCKLSLCINGYVPTHEVLSFINAVHQQVTWVRPDKAHPDDVALGPVMWEDPSRAFVQVRSDHEIRMIIVVVYKPAPED